MSDILISVIISTYNEGNNLERCLKSLVNQSDPNYELIIVDDGTESSDMSMQIMDCFSYKYSNVKVIHKKNEGSISARITGVKNASGKYITFVDADDFVSPNYIKTIVKIVNNQKADLYQLNNKINKKDKQQFKIEKNFLIDNSKINITQMYEWVLTGKAGAIWDKIYLRSLFPNVKSPIFFGDDVIINIKYLENVNSIYTFNESIYFHFCDSETSGSTTSKNYKKFYDIDGLYKLIKKLRNKSILTGDVFDRFVQVYLTDIAHGAGDLYRLGINKKEITALLNQLEIINDYLYTINSQNIRKKIYIWCLRNHKYTLLAFIDKVVHG